MVQHERSLRERRRLDREGGREEGRDRETQLEGNRNRTVSKTFRASLIQITLHLNQIDLKPELTQ